MAADRYGRGSCVVVGRVRETRETWSALTKTQVVMVMQHEIGRHLVGMITAFNEYARDEKRVVHRAY